jgi:Ribonuclease G/E
MMRTFGKGRELLVRCHPEVGKALRNGEAQVRKEIEEMTNKVVTIKADPLMHVEHFELIERK